jgi:hypothetical protein
MAETQAKSGNTGTSIDPAELDARTDDGAGSEVSVDRTAVGRASVPSEPATPRSDLGVDHKIDKPLEGPGSVSTSTISSTDRRGVDSNRGGAPAAMTRKPPPNRVTGAAPGVEPAPNTGAARVAEAVRTARATVSGAASRGPRRARLFVKRIDPWSVMKFSFAVSFVMFFVLVVATSVLYLALDQMNVFTSINKALATLLTSKNGVKVTATAVIGAAGAVGLVMVVLFTALSTLAAFIYNVCADLVGGIEVTLSEKE